MHIKTRGKSKRANLYRSSWIHKGTEGGNTHGFSRQTFVGSLPVDAEAIPDDIKLRLSSEELAFVERAVIAPAKAASEKARREAEHKERDPMWRLEEALRLLGEAASLSVDAHVPQGRLKALSEALAGVKGVGAASARHDSLLIDPLSEVLNALRAAAHSVRDGHYGDGPQEGVRRTKTYQHWTEICQSVDGTAREGGLLRALQSRGWVKAKGHG
jgi:hypothetical protein